MVAWWVFVGWGVCVVPAWVIGDGVVKEWIASMGCLGLMETMGSGVRLSVVDETFCGY